MTDIPTMFDNFVKLVQKQLETSTDTTNDIEEKIDDEIESFGIPQTKVAVFWDYENFPIPSNVNESLFFEVLFSSGSEERIISKRVYSKPEIIRSRLELIRKHNFEYKQGILSHKTNEVDNILISDCTQFCAKSTEPLLVVLMAGDADYLSLIETLTKDGHEVRLVCNSSNKISLSLKEIVPVIFDLEKLYAMINELRNNLFTFSFLTNYLLTLGNNNTLEIDALAEEIQQYYITDLNKKIASLIKFMQTSPDYNWQYTIANGKITRNTIIESIGPSDSVPNRALAHKQGLLFKLGYEEDFDEWEKTWNDYKQYEKNKTNLKNILHELYKIVPIPKVRNNIQKELVTMLFYEQTSTIPPHNQRFRNFKSQNPDKPFSCSQCNRAFPYKHSLNQHIRAVHRNK